MTHWYRIPRTWVIYLGRGIHGPQLQKLIRQGLEQNSDLQTAILKVKGQRQD